ncbi:hypothetical protein AWE51_00190 [Aquimarina aggregata]|uniref:Uncharacterized protein n=1 Tax=Aquimarina aggregata TaxID=1642818 RepID=A0A163BYL5_9FLAO|nr:hypothetical protein [Aquimarina aggregata]KZS41900.1 hypothetical protein AWE51_00190 [Aquimarina aggregata]
MIEQWFLNKGTYAQGLVLLKAACGANQRMYLRLKGAKENQRNLAALKYELNKYRNTNIEVPIPTKKKVQTSKKVSDTKALAITSVKRSNTKITIHMLPDAYLQQRFIEKNNAFYTHWVLKKKLNAVAEDDVEKARVLIAEIMKLRQLIDAIWKELDYYMEHKKLMPKGKDFANLSAMDKVKTRQRLYQSRSKREKTLNKWLLKLVDTPKEKQLALQSRIDNQKGKIAQINIDITTLNSLINNQ